MVLAVAVVSLLPILLIIKSLTLVKIPKHPKRHLKVVK